MDSATLAFLAAPFIASLILTGIHAYLGVHVIERGVISSLAPTVSPAALGYPVMAFCTLQIQQRKGRQAVVDHLEGIPEVLEVHTITGSGDLLARIVGRNNADLQRVIDQIVGTGLVVHASTTIALAELVAHRTLPLVPEAGSR